MKWKDEQEACPEQQWKEKRHMQRAPCMGKPELQPLPEAGAAEAQMSSGNLHAAPRRVFGQVGEWVTSEAAPAPGSATRQPAQTAQQRLAPRTARRRMMLASDWWVPPGEGFSSRVWHGHTSFPCVSLQAPCLLHQRGPALAFFSPPM